MNIKEIEQRSGLPRSGVRFYESEGLLSPARSPNGYRDYSEGDLDTLLKIKRLRALGLSLAEIKDIQRGDLPLADALRALMDRLHELRGGLEGAEAECRSLIESGAGWDDMMTVSLPAPEDSLPAPPEERRRALERFMRFDLSALIVCHGVELMPECRELAERYDRTLLRTQEDTSTFMADLISMLRNALAPRLTLHGVLVEVSGEGLLITGDSGVGKSETALELIKRGHRLIADDAVEVRRINRTTLIGTAPALIRYYMELRGIGVVDVRHTFGVGAVKPETDIDLVVNFELWDDGKAYDRLGLETEYTDILGVSLPMLTIPVRPGRNLAVILELAAMNNRQKKMGYNAAQALAAEHDELVNMGKEF